MSITSCTSRLCLPRPPPPRRAASRTLCSERTAASQGWSRNPKDRARARRESSSVERFTRHRQLVLNSHVYGLCSETPLAAALGLSAQTGNRVWLKREDLQATHAFNVRGAHNRMAALSPEERARGVVAPAAGNHVQGVALSAAALGIESTVVVPRSVTGSTLEQVHRLGAGHVRVVTCGDDFAEGLVEAERLAKAENAVLVHPFDDELVIAGQGTVGSEIVAQTSGGRELDAVFCVAGGGGLLAGVAAYIKSVRPEVQVFGVEMRDAAPMHASLSVGMRVTLPRAGHFVDEAALTAPGRHTFRLCRDNVDGIILVDTDEVCAAIKAGFEDCRALLEPAGAMGIAGITKHAAATGVTGQDFVAITSGANMDFDRLRFVAERADSSESFVSVTIPERPGAFARLYALVEPRNVTEFSYRVAPAPPSGSTHGAEEVFTMDGVQAGPAHIFLSYVDSAPSSSERAADEEFHASPELHQRLEEEGYGVVNLSDNDLAKTHARNFVGGRAHVPHERIVRFKFPERPGALKRFLDTLSTSVHWDFHTVEPWNCTLFHYRSHGDDVGRVLAGIEVKPEHEDAFEHFLETLGYDYVDETGNDCVDFLQASA